MVAGTSGKGRVRRPSQCRTGACDHARVPSEFLPPDPYADAPGVHRPGAQRPTPQPAFVPPNAQLPAPAKGQNNRSVAALALGSAGLGVLFFSAGALFLLTLPASIAGWILGQQAKRRDAGREQANVAVIIGIVGTVLGVVAAVVWILIIAFTDWTTSNEIDAGGGQNPRFDVVRAVTQRP
jgi:hypothetical protein